MSELRIYRGLPGSGKTTRAREDGALPVPYHTAQGPADQMLVKATTHILAGRDHIRRALGIEGGVGTPEEENVVTQIQTRVIRQGLQMGKVVHVDDMNLREQYVKRLQHLSEKLLANSRVIDLREAVSLEECIVNDAKRRDEGGHYVGEARIRDLHRRFIAQRARETPKVPGRKGMPESYKPELYVPGNGRDAFIVDLDGTTALKSPDRGFHDYDDRVSLDIPNEPVIAVVRALINRGWKPIFLSGRMDSCREATRTWITRHIIAGPFDLFMRKTGDHRPDYEVKDELFTRHILGLGLRIGLAIDDRNQVVDLWRAKGIPTLQVAEGNF